MQYKKVGMFMLNDTGWSMCKCLSFVRQRVQSLVKVAESQLELMVLL